MKEPDSYLFTAESNQSKQLVRVVITKDVNKIMRQVSDQLPDKPNSLLATVFELVIFRIYLPSRHSWVVI